MGEERPAQAATTVVGMDAELFEVSGIVNEVDQRVADGYVALDDDPGAAGRHVGGELFDRGWFMGGDLRKPDVDEKDAGGALDPP